jgi:hypothetical protein
LTEAEIVRLTSDPAEIPEPEADVVTLQVTGRTGRELTALNPNRLKRLARIGAMVDMRRVVIYL